MQRQLEQFIYEKGVVDICRERKMRGVIRGLASGKLQTPAPFSLTLHYLVFEWAEGDLAHHASPDEPQYEIRSDRTDHVAMHKGKALKSIGR